LITVQAHGQDSSGDDINYVAKTGYVLVINNVIFRGREISVRTGSDEDEERLLDLFDDFKFHIIVHRNLERSGMINILTHTSKEDFSKFDTFVCVILSHGSEDGIYGIDDQVITLEAITSFFHGNECPSLQGKPKIFLISGCQGTPVDPVFLSNPSFQADADFLICYTLVPGYVSFRSVSVGSCFISAVYKVFKEYANKEHIMDMMLRVDNEMAGSLTMQGLKQMLCLISTLTKKVFFNRD